MPPPGIRRYLGFTKLSTAAVQAVARVLDRDVTYRSQVAAALDEDAVGRAAWLWLNRPEGWHDEFAALEAEAAANAATASVEREERDARKRLSAARAAAERATATATAREQEAAQIRADLVTEQAHRRRLERRVAEMEGELTQARDERAAAVRQLKHAEANLARRVAEAKEATARLRELERRPGPATADERPQVPVVDAAELAEALDHAAGQATELAASLRELTQLMLPSGEPGPTTAPASPRGTSVAPLTDPAGTASGADPATAATMTDEPDGIGLAGSAEPTEPGLAAVAPVLRRTALTLPGGMRDDSPEAVERLLRAPGAWLLIDGYNVSMVGWPEWPVAEQRHRLVAALGEIAARTGASVKVIFDGAAIQPVPTPQSGRRLVSVLFSPAGVEADDMLLDLVRQLPPAQPVVVASSDKRVREGARRLGANLIHARQLLEALRR